ncbi:MAG TPA: copper transporter [Coriobacteriia bacterium]
MYNLRYHIASLVAVFLALAIGLVLGGLVVRQGVFDQQQRALVTSLQSEFGKLSKENSSLKASLSLEDAYAAQMTDQWTANRLAGRTVVIVTSGAPSEGADAAAAAVKSAGGKAAVVTFAKPGFGLSRSAVASAAASALGSATVTPTQEDVAKQLAAEWSGTSTAHTLTDALVAAGELKTSGLSGSTVATMAVDLAAFDRSPDAAALDLAQAYGAAGMYALGAEALDSNTGVAAAAAARKLSAFDTLGTNAGRFTLVALLTGGQQGYYSNNARGVSLFPAVPAP